MISDTRTRSLAACLLFLLSCRCFGQQVALTGGGATFPYPVYSRWFEEYHKARPNIQISYEPNGSGLGLKYLFEGKKDFAGSDAPLNDVQIRSLSELYGSGTLLFPTVVGAVVPAYNVPGVTADINFTPEVLTSICVGKITKWNDPELIKSNPKVKLPNNDIVFVHRSDQSGTTYVWTDYLAKVSFEFRHKYGRDNLVNWPTGRGGNGNQGVSALVQQTPYSLGYVELAYAMNHRLSYGAVRNSSGAFVKADAASVTAAAEAAAPFLPDDFRFSIANSPAKSAYPIASFTWLVIPPRKDKAKAEALQSLVRWVLGPGQNIVEPLGFSKLPANLIARELENVPLIR